MRRLTLALALLLVAANVAAIDTRTRTAPLRISVLASSEHSFGVRETQAAELVRGAIRNALRERGYDAFTTGDRYDDLRRGEGRLADYYVEIIASGAQERAVGGVAFPVGGGLGAELDVVIDRVAAEVRLYDGKTLGEIRTFDLRRQSTAVAPSAVLASRSIWAVVALPVWEWSRYRGAAREIGSEAAGLIAEELPR
jgi:hypothetical protein